MNIQQLTYDEAKRSENTTELVLQAKESAYNDSEKFSDFDLFRLNFNYFEINGEWNHSFVILPKKFFDEVSSDWSSQDFNRWVDTKSIYYQSLISDLSTNPIKLKTIRSAKFKNV
jgi:hypothetical protein